MKKFFSLRNIILLSGALLVLVAFFLSFAASFKFISTSGWYQKAFHIIWGCDKIDMNGSIQYADAENKIGVAVIPFIGIWLMLVGALGVVIVALAVKKPWAKWVVICFAVLILAGAIMQFFIFDAFCRAYVHKAAEMNHWTKQEEIAEYKHFKEQYGYFDHRAPVSAIMGAFGITGALAAVASRFIPEKK